MAPYGGPSFSGRNRSSKDGGPSGVQRNYATQLKEHEPLFNTYEHLSGLPRGDAALTLLRKVASTVKPIMRKHGWRVQILAEFLPPEGNLLGLNINRGYKICIRLRYHSNTDLFLPLEQIVDTMLHELSHNRWGDHDSRFHALWDELREEHETLVRRGYTGEGFLGEGRKLGGGRPPTERDLRQLARAGAEKRRTLSTLSSGSGRRLGGSDIMLGQDAREVIAGQALLRNTVNKGCASTRSDAGSLAQSSTNPTFKTKAEEDDANDRAITQAIYELMEEEEAAKLNGTFTSAPSTGGLAWSRDHGLYDPSIERLREPTEDEQMKWAMEESTRASKSSSKSPRASGALPSESLISPVKQPLYASSNSPRSSAGTSRASTVISSKPPSTITSPVSPLYINNHNTTRSTAPTSSRAPSTILTNPSPVSPLAQTDTAPSKRKASSSASSYSRQTNQQTKPPSIRSESIISSPITAAAIDLSEPFNPDQWTCEICTCINPTRYLACDACGIERPSSQLAGASRRRTAAALEKRSASSAAAAYQPSEVSGLSARSSRRYDGGGGGSGVGSSSSSAGRTRRSKVPSAYYSGSGSTSTSTSSKSRTRERETVGWSCLRCGAFMEHQWWTCSACGTLKESS